MEQNKPGAASFSCDRPTLNWSHCLDFTVSPPISRQPSTLIRGQSDQEQLRGRRDAHLTVRWPPCETAGFIHQFTLRLFPGSARWITSTGVRWKMRLSGSCSRGLNEWLSLKTSSTLRCLPLRNNRDPTLCKAYRCKTVDSFPRSPFTSSSSLSGRFQRF